MRAIALRPAAALLPLLLSLAACVAPGAVSRGAGLAADPAECGAGAACRFRNAPLQLEPGAITLPGRPYPFHAMARELDFVDGRARAWVAPKATLTDGASIPPLFVPIVGSPRTPEFALAAALHDAYCGAGNEDGPVWHAARWQDVHRMFYDTLVTAGTPPAKAKVMFAAVWLGGPRWYPQSKRPDTRIDRLPDDDRRAALRAAIAFIQRRDPPLPALIAFLERAEAEAFLRLDPMDPAERGQGPGAGQPQ